MAQVCVGAGSGAMMQIKSDIYTHAATWLIAERKSETRSKRSKNNGWF
jgi:hypothetical protein